MDRAGFFQLLDIPDPEEFVTTTIDTLKDVYRFNADRHEPEMGDDAQTFGFLVYRNGWFQLENAYALLTGVKTSRPNNSLEIRTDGGVTFHVYRGGNDETFDIFTYDFRTGTQTKVTLSERNGYQLSLFDLDRELDGGLAEAEEYLTELVLVHAGNAEEGLTGLWVGAPVPEGQNGSQWAWVLPLYEQAIAATATEDPTPTPMPSYDSLAEPDLDLRLPEDEDDAGSQET